MESNRFSKSLWVLSIFVTVFHIVEGFLNPQFRFQINFLPTSAPIPPKTADCFCGVSAGIPENGSPGRIVNGTAAEKYKWKWQAAIVLRGQDSPICGGSLISDKLALIPALAEVVLNDYDTTLSNETVTIRRNIHSATPHPRYNPTTQDNDVAVIELSKPVDLTATEEPTVTPVCLPAKESKDLFVADIGTVTGWGTTTEGKFHQSDVLMQAEVPVISNEECNKHYDGRITPRMICAGDPNGGIGPCQGDSGGPLVVPGTDGRYFEIGVVSFGQGCARAGKEGVYARVTELNDWIRNTARGATWCRE